MNQRTIIPLEVQLVALQNDGGVRGGRSDSSGWGGSGNMPAPIYFGDNCGIRELMDLIAIKWVN